MSIVMDTVSVDAAGKLLDFPAAIIEQLHSYGLIQGDGLMVDIDDAARVVDELRATMRPFVGVPILISDAARKYGFNPGSIYNWVIGGWVKVLIEQPKRQVDEGDIALAKAIANLQGHIAGRAVFPAKPRSGRPRKEP